MTVKHSRTPLADGAAIGSYVIRKNLGADEQGYRYLADHPQHRSVLLHEFFAHDFAQRENQAMTPADAGDRVALRWWVRSYLERAHALAALRHPRLLGVLDTGEHLGGAYCASAAPETPLLQTRLERSGALAAGSAETLFIDLLDALETLHSGGFVHRAISPQTIWAGDNGQATLGGFGSLRAAIRFKSRSVHSVAPAPYAAPEELQADGQVSATADIYAIAAVMLHAVTGQPPPAADRRLAGAALPSTAAAVDNGLPASLAAGIEHGLALQAGQRPQTIAQWREQMKLKTASVQLAPAAAPAATPERSKSWALVALPLTLVAGIAGFMLIANKPSTPSAPAATPAPIERAATDADRPRFVSASLNDGDAAPALNQAAINAFGSEADEVPATTPAPRSQATPAAGTVAPEPTTAAAEIPPVPASDRIETTPAPDAAEVATLTAPTTEPIAPGTAAVPVEDPATRHAQQLALERSRCTRHVSELFANRDFTYADIAKFEDVVQLDDGRLQTPKLRTDDGRRVSFLIDSQGCIVRMLR